MRLWLPVAIAILAAGAAEVFYPVTHPVIQVAMLGDSITAKMAPLQSEFPSPFNRATNLGVSGNTVAQIFARVGSIPAGTTHVTLQGGINDLLGLGTDEGILPGYTAILNAIPTSKTVIVMGIEPIDETAIRTDYLRYLTNAKIKQENELISNLCRQHSNCVAANDVMTMNVRGQTTDGIHPLAPLDAKIIDLLMLLLGRPT